jgi:hypothetical protein
MLIIMDLTKYTTKYTVKNYKTHKIINKDALLESLGVKQEIIKVKKNK